MDLCRVVEDATVAKGRGALEALVIRLLLAAEADLALAGMRALSRGRLALVRRRGSAEVIENVAATVCRSMHVDNPLARPGWETLGRGHLVSPVLPARNPHARARPDWADERARLHELCEAVGDDTVRATELLAECMWHASMSRDELLHTVLPMLLISHGPVLGVWGWLATGIAIRVAAASGDVQRVDALIDVTSRRAWPNWAQTLLTEPCAVPRILGGVLRDRFALSDDERMRARDVIARATT